MSVKRKRRIPWLLGATALASVAGVSGILAMAIATVVEREIWNSTIHSINDTRQFIYAGYPQPISGSQAGSVAGGSIGRAILVDKDEYISGEVPVEAHGEQFVVPIKEISFVEADPERRDRLIGNLNEEISAHPDEWGWRSIEVEVQKKEYINNEWLEYIVLTIRLPGFWDERYEYVASQAVVEPRRIVLFRQQYGLRVLALQVTVASGVLALGCLLRLAYLIKSDRVVSANEEIGHDR